MDSPTKPPFKLCPFFLPRRVRWSFWPLLRCQLFGVQVVGWRFWTPIGGTSSHILYDGKMFYVVVLIGQKICEFCRKWNKKASNQEIFLSQVFKQFGFAFVILLDGCPIPLVSSWVWWFFNRVDGVLRSHPKFFFSANELLRPYCWMGVLSWFMKQRHVLLWRRKLLRNIQEQMPVGVLCKNTVENSAFDVNLVWGDQKDKTDVYMYDHVCIYTLRN